MKSGIFINDYKLKNKKFKSSMSTNKRERKKKVNQKEKNYHYLKKNIQKKNMILPPLKEKILLLIKI